MAAKSEIRAIGGDVTPPSGAPERLTEAEHAELTDAFAVVAQMRTDAETALAAMRDAEAVANYLMRKIGTRYGLAEGDRIEDDGAITRTAKAE